MEQLRDRWQISAMPPPPTLKWLTEEIRRASGGRLTVAGANSYARFLCGDAFLMDMICGKEALP